MSHNLHSAQPCVRRHVNHSQNGRHVRRKAGGRQDVPGGRDGDHQVRARLLRADGARGLARHGEGDIAASDWSLYRQMDQ